MNLQCDDSLVAVKADEPPVSEAISPAGFGHRQRRPWLLAGISWRTLTHLRIHKQVEEFLKLPPFIDTVQDNPKFGFKYLTESYLINDISIADRAACFLHHYKRLYESLPDRLLRQVLHWGIDLCEFCEEGVRFALRWGSSRPFGKEGEMSLLLLANGEILFTISFTIIPGWIAKSEQREVILISRIQGTPGWPADKMRQAQRGLHKLRFGAVLLSGLEGLATAFNICEIVSVVATKQISYTEAFADRFRHAYDDFFTDMGITRTEAGFFSIPLPLEERAIEEVKDHKARARARRALKKRISVLCAECVTAAMDCKAARSDISVPDQTVVISKDHSQTSRSSMNQPCHEVNEFMFSGEGESIVASSGSLSTTGKFQL
jgi:uncharacterized protein VirK/YbjX